MKIRLLLIAAIPVLLLVAACGGDSEPAATPTATPTPTTSATGAEPMPTGETTGATEGEIFEVGIVDVKHTDIEIPVGTTVVWSSGAAGGLTVHTVTSGQPGGSDEGALFDSGEFEGGESFSHTFNETGEFPYFCRRHPFFSKAVVTVVEK